MKRAIFSLCVLVLTASAAAQNVGDQATAQYDSQRGGANFQMGDFGPPLLQERTVDLLGVADVRNCLTFEGFLAVREGAGGLNPGRYSIYDLTDDTDPLPPVTTFSFMSADGAGSYSPSFSNDILLLSESSTGSVAGVRASTGTRLWTVGDLGETAGRSPVLSGNLAVFSGSSRVVAAEADSGIVLWQVATSTLRAPLAMLNSRAYFLDGQGALNIVDSLSGQVTGMSAPVGADGSSLIANEKLVFLTNPTSGLLGAVDSFSGEVVWSDEFEGLAEDPGIVLAYNILFAFSNSNADGVAEVRAYRPNTGQLLWSAADEGPGANFGLAANNSVYYFNAAAASVRVRDAFSGVLLFDIPTGAVRGLIASNQRLLVQGASEVAIYAGANRIYFPQVADGEGQSTLVTLINLSDQEARGMLRFFNTEGNPMQVPVEGVVGNTSTVSYVIPPRSSRRIQTGNGPSVQVGWAQATTDRVIRGTSIFQFSDAGAVLYEAGVSQATPIAEAGIFVLRQQRPGVSGTMVNFSTALAIANPFSRATNLVLLLLDANGDPMADDTLTLEPRNQLARFIEELFPDDVGPDFEGTLLITADNPFVVTSIRSQAGFQLSSLPAGQVR